MPLCKPRKRRSPVANDPITAAIELGVKLIDKMFPNPKDKAEAFLKLKELEQSGDLAVISNQIEVNKIEASSPRVFVSGWRPFIGWVCGCALAFQLVLGPVIVWVNALRGTTVALPAMQTELLTTLLVGMLGLGSMRTVEKLNGVAK